MDFFLFFFYYIFDSKREKEIFYVYKPGLDGLSFEFGLGAGLARSKPFAKFVCTFVAFNCIVLVSIGILSLDSFVLVSMPFSEGSWLVRLLVLLLSLCVSPKFDLGEMAGETDSISRSLINNVFVGATLMQDVVIIFGFTFESADDVVVVEQKTVF